jgi:transposase
MRYAGLDVHKRVVEAVVIDQAGAILVRQRFPTERAHLEAFAREHLGPDVSVALEATTNTWGVFDVLEPLVGEIVASNPLRTRAIAEAKVKTDKVDALVLAQLLRADYLPRVWRPDDRTRHMRQLTTLRASLVADRTSLKNRIHAVLHQRLIHPPMDDLFGTKGLAWLQAVELDPIGRCTMDRYLRLLAEVGNELDVVTHVIAQQSWQDDRVKLLMTLPGVDVTVAHALLAALGDLSRFKDGDHAASYLGIVPSTRQSADHTYHGRITKHGNGHARWLLVQAAQHLDKHPGPLGVFFRRLAAKKNRNVAVVATARKLVVIAFHMLKSNEPYRYAQPRSTEGKLARLRVAVGKKRKSGPAPRAPRTDSPPVPGGTRKIKSLDELCASEGLPSPKPLSHGESRMLADRGLTEFADAIRTSRRVPRRKAGKQGT